MTSWFSVTLGSCIEWWHWWSEEFPHNGCSACTAYGEMCHLFLLMHPSFGQYVVLYEKFNSLQEIWCPLFRVFMSTVTFHTTLKFPFLGTWLPVFPLEEQENFWHISCYLLIAILFLCGTLAHGSMWIYSYALERNKLTKYDKLSAIVIHVLTACVITREFKMAWMKIWRVMALWSTAKNTRDVGDKGRHCDGVCYNGVPTSSYPYVVWCVRSLSTTLRIGRFVASFELEKLQWLVQITQAENCLKQYKDIHLLRKCILYWNFLSTCKSFIQTNVNSRFPFLLNWQFPEIWGNSFHGTSSLNAERESCCIDKFSCGIFLYCYVWIVQTICRPDSSFEKNRWGNKMSG